MADSKIKTIEEVEERRVQDLPVASESHENQLVSSSSSLDPSEENSKLHAPLKRIYYVGKFMDSQFSIPILGEIGFDPIIGLVPVAGDIVGYLVSMYIIIEAGRMGVPATKVVRMSANALIDALFGYIPFAGDVVDVAYKANSRNVNIVLEHFEAEIDNTGEFKKLPVSKPALTMKTKLILWAALLLLLLFLALVIAIPILIGIWIFSK